MYAESCTELVLLIYLLYLVFSLSFSSIQEMKDEVSNDLESVVNIQPEIHNIGIKATNLCISPCGKLLSVYLQKTVSFYSLDKDLSESVFS